MGQREGDVEAWYADIKEETFATVFIPLTIADARALIALFYQDVGLEDAAIEQHRRISDLEASLNSWRLLSDGSSRKPLTAL